MQLSEALRKVRRCWWSATEELLILEDKDWIWRISVIEESTTEDLERFIKILDNLPLQEFMQIQENLLEILEEDLPIGATPSNNSVAHALRKLTERELSRRLEP